MLNVLTHKARPGMTLAMAVLHPHHPGHLLLKPGCTLDSPMLARLIELRVHDMWIRYPALEAVVRYVSPEIIHAHAQLTHVLGESLDAAARETAADLDFSSYASAVKALLAKLGEEPGRQLLVTEMACDRALTAHASNVCFLSLLMGLKLEAYLVAQRSKLAPQHARNVENLGVGALLHDIGCLRLPAEISQRYDRTGNDTDEEWRKHVQLGIETVHGHVEPSALVTIAQHHQRYDGKGFPWVETNDGRRRLLSGEQIHVFARIVHVADAFDRLRNSTAALKRNGNLRPPAVRVLRDLLGRARRREIDPIVFKALLAVAPAFTPGTIVTLSDGRHCGVVGVDRLHPCRPVVQPIMGDPDNPVDSDSVGRKVDLHEHQELFIVEAEGQRVSEDLFSADSPVEFDVRHIAIPDHKQPHQPPPVRSAIATAVR